MRYYLDTAIWIDLYENRKGYNEEPLGDYAFKLFAMIKSKKGNIIITDLTITELGMHYTMPEIKGMINPFEYFIERLLSSKKQRNQSMKIARERNIPKGDALHAVIARDSNLILVTRDSHFKKLKDISMYYKPEEII